MKNRLRAVFHCLGWVDWWGGLGWSACTPGNRSAELHQTRRHQHLAWYEIHTDITAAITREKQQKRWHRDWKINLIQSSNATWRELYADICG